MILKKPDQDESSSKDDSSTSIENSLRSEYSYKNLIKKHQIEFEENDEDGDDDDDESTDELDDNIDEEDEEDNVPDHVCFSPPQNSRTIRKRTSKKNKSSKKHPTKPKRFPAPPTLINSAELIHNISDSSSIHDSLCELQDEHQKRRLLRILSPLQSRRHQHPIF